MPKTGACVRDFSFAPSRLFLIYLVLVLHRVRGRDVGDSGVQGGVDDLSGSGERDGAREFFPRSMVRASAAHASFAFSSFYLILDRGMVLVHARQEAAAHAHLGQRGGAGRSGGVGRGRGRITSAAL